MLAAHRRSCRPSRMPSPHSYRKQTITRNSSSCSIHPNNNCNSLIEIRGAILLIGKAEQFQGIILQICLGDHFICYGFIPMVFLLGRFQPFHQRQKYGRFVWLLTRQFQTSLQCIQSRPVGDDDVSGVYKFAQGTNKCKRISHTSHTSYTHKHRPKATNINDEQHHFIQLPCSWAVFK